MCSLLETADQSFIGHLLYYYSISNYAKPLALAKGDMTWWAFLDCLKCFVEIPPNGIFSKVVHCKHIYAISLSLHLNICLRNAAATTLRGKKIFDSQFRHNVQLFPYPVRGGSDSKNVSAVVIRFSIRSQLINAFSFQACSDSVFGDVSRSYWGSCIPYRYVKLANGIFGLQESLWVSSLTCPIYPWIFSPAYINPWATLWVMFGETYLRIDMTTLSIKALQ
jgi:hypothetical protein